MRCYSLTECETCERLDVRVCPECGTRRDGGVYRPFALASVPEQIEIDDAVAEDRASFDALAEMLDMNARADDERDGLLGRDEHADVAVPVAPVLSFPMRSTQSRAA